MSFTARIGMAVAACFAGVGTSTAAAELQLHTVEYKSVGGDALLLDVWSPVEATGNQSDDLRPVVIVVHGGGWGSGDRKTMIPSVLETLRSAGYVYVSMDYRLVPPHTWHECYADVVDAIAWTKTHVCHHGGDPDRMAILGYSAGGQLAFLAGMRDEAPHKLRAMIGLAPATDLLEDLGRRGGMNPHMQAVIGHKHGEPLKEYLLKMYQASPINHVHEAMPPILLIHGSADRSVPFVQSEQLRLRIEDTDWGVPCEVYRIAGAPHRQTEWDDYDEGYQQKLVEWLAKRLSAEETTD